MDAITIGAVVLIVVREIVSFVFTMIKRSQEKKEKEHEEEKQALERERIQKTLKEMTPPQSAQDFAFAIQEIARSQEEILRNGLENKELLAHMVSKIEFEQYKQDTKKSIYELYDLDRKKAEKIGEVENKLQYICGAVKTKFNI